MAGRRRAHPASAPREWALSLYLHYGYACDPAFRDALDGLYADHCLALDELAGRGIPLTLSHLFPGGTLSLRREQRTGEWVSGRWEEDASPEVLESASKIRAFADDWKLDLLYRTDGYDALCLWLNVRQTAGRTKPILVFEDGRTKRLPPSDDLLLADDGVHLKWNPHPDVARIEAELDADEKRGDDGPELAFVYDEGESANSITARDFGRFGPMTWLPDPEVTWSADGTDALVRADGEPISTFSPDRETVVQAHLRIKKELSLVRRAIPKEAVRVELERIAAAWDLSGYISHGATPRKAAHAQWLYRRVVKSESYDAIADTLTQQRTGELLDRITVQAGADELRHALHMKPIPRSPRRYIDRGTRRNR